MLKSCFWDLFLIPIAFKNKKEFEIVCLLFIDNVLTCLPKELICHYLVIHGPMLNIRISTHQIGYSSPILIKAAWLGQMKTSQ